MKNYQYFHQIPLQIRFSDIDMMGHVTNSVYLSFLDTGRIDYFNKVLGLKVDRNHRSLIIARIEIDFKDALLLEDNAIQENKIIKIGNKSLSMKQQIRADDQIKALSKVVMTGFNYDTGKSIPIPEEWKNTLRAFEKDIEF